MASSIRINAEKIFEKAKVPEKEHVIQVDMEIHSLIKVVIDEVTQLKNMLQPRKAISGEDENQRKFRDQRGQSLSDIFRSIDISEIMKNDVRNAMEQFDERLDRLSFSVRKNICKRSQRIAFNMVFSDNEAMSPFPNPVRIYISNERKIYVFGLTLDLGKIHEESSKILEILKEDPRRKTIREPGGILLLIEKLDSSEQF
ncbi:hypothetical protein DMB44_04825 [Thermoplasma sp. Kam2015]|uniref:hypothetical protein n=1 Tax=Thermoplasma sp. Kam2015 TaxID=2094122 RepID=UPI000D983613|nr:hypothetical protein [Thermoplasma sp. Kam2015]PYB68365.1 hypothetical protein DMB44_04825 [Thermoplasma sp. Kam2015]